MRIRTCSDGILLLSGFFLNFAPLVGAEAQDVDVPGNLTMHDSRGSAVGNVLKEGVPFLHNYGMNNTFLGINAGNFTMGGDGNTATGVEALRSNTTGQYNTANGMSALQFNTIGNNNTASGLGALFFNTSGNNNTASGFNTLSFNTTGDGNTANGASALSSNATGSYNTASGFGALFHNDIGSSNTAIGYLADVSVGNLTNATAIGAGATVDDSNKIRLGDANVTVIEGQVPFTYTSDRNQKQNFRTVDADEVLTKLRGLSVTSWNYKGQDAKQFRHYGPVAQDFFAAFGHDAVGTVGTPTTITSGDLDGILIVAVQALEKRTVQQMKEIDALRVENADLKARLVALEGRVGREFATTKPLRGPHAAAGCARQ